LFSAVQLFVAHKEHNNNNSCLLLFSMEAANMLHLKVYGGAKVDLHTSSFYSVTMSGPVIISRTTMMTLNQCCHLGWAVHNRFSEI